MTMRRPIAILVLTACLAALAGCGQKGPLVLPPAKASTPAPSPARVNGTPEAAPASTHSAPAGTGQA